MNEDQEENVIFRPEVNLHDIIRDRKVERKLNAEQKRQLDLQLIRDMRSATGLDPLQLFPKEIWVQILDELGTEDRWNVCHVHPLFRDLMENNCIRDILFPLVLQVDAFQSSNKGNFGSQFNEQFRLISKNTKISFDRHMQNILKKNIKQMEVDPDDTKGYVDLPFSLSLPAFPRERQWQKRFIKSFSGEGENVVKCFFPRALSVTFSSTNILILGDENLQDFIDEFCNDITDLLKTIGDQIWRFKLDLSGIDEVQEAAKLTKFRYVYIMLQSWLTLMPNLKWLELAIDIDAGQMIHESSENRKFSKAKSVLRKNPFPHLVHLERLTFQSPYAYHGYTDVQNKRSLNIYGIILEANQHIKMLDLRADDSGRVLLPSHLSKGLQLTWFSALDNDFSHCQFSPSACISVNRIQPMVNFNWPLKTIILSLQSDFADDSESLSSNSSSSSGLDFSYESILSVFRFLQQFPTLEKVELRQLHEFNFYDIDEMEYLELPNLTELVLNITSPSIYYDDSDINFFFSLQFLLHCKKLKRISWKLVRPVNLEFLEKFEKESEVEMVDFRGGMRYLYDSNIWDVFPYLESVYVRVGSCEHEYFRKYIDVMSPQRFLNTHRCSRNNELRKNVSCLSNIKFWCFVCQDWFT